MKILRQEEKCHIQGTERQGGRSIESLGKHVIGVSRGQVMYDLLDHVKDTITSRALQEADSEMQISR